MRLGVKWAVSCVAVVALAGCGGTTQAVTAEAPRPAATTPAAPAPTKAQERKTARAAVVELDDLPVGWSTDDDDPPSSSQKTTPKCPGAKGARAARTARADSGGFLVDSDEDEARQVVNLFPDRAQAAATFEALMGRAERVCDARVMVREEQTGDLTLTDARSSEFRVERLGDRTAAKRFVVSYATAEETGESVREVVSTLVGRGISVASFTDVQPKKRAAFSRAAASRLQRVLAKQP